MRLQLSNNQPNKKLIKKILQIRNFIYSFETSKGTNQKTATNRLTN